MYVFSSVWINLFENGTLQRYQYRTALGPTVYTECNRTLCFQSKHLLVSVPAKTDAFHNGGKNLLIRFQVL